MTSVFYKLTDSQKKEIFSATAQRKGLPIYVVEKDWWVVQTLSVIFQLDISKHILFKGGTSLSKAWGIINRFSEDIDLALDKSYLGFNEGLISKTQVRKLRSKSFEFVTTHFYEMLQNKFKENGLEDVTFDFENLGDGDQDPVSILMFYPTVADYSEYVLPRIKIEIGSRSMKEPFSLCKVSSFISEEFPKRDFADIPIEIPCVNPERTYLEKMYLLHEEFQRPKDKIRVQRLSRHLYDLIKIYRTEYKNKAYDKDLIISIIQHRERFSGMKGVNYQSLYPPTLNPIPPTEFQKLWEQDYKTMKDNMIPEKSPSFDELLKTVQKAADEYNALNLASKHTTSLTTLKPPKRKKIDLCKGGENHYK